MDEFRNKQQFGSGGPRNSLDGFTRPKKPVQSPLKPNHSRTSGKTATSNAMLDNFNKADGFQSNARQRSVQATPVRPKRPYAMEEPLFITKQPKQYKRGFFGLGRKKPMNADGQRKKKMTRKKKILLGIAAFITIILLIGGFLVLKGYINLNKVLKGGGGAAALQSDVDPSKLKGEGDGRVNVLLLGRGGEGHDGADLTDTIIVASIDPVAKEAALVSIPRDLYVPVTNQGSMKINAVFATGKEASLRKANKQTNETKKQAEEAGFTLLEKTIEKNLGLPIHYRTIIDFQGFQQAVDTVGGVTVNAPAAVTETMRINGKNYKLDVKPGVQQMDGFKALAYSRSRHTSPRGDFDRAERQRLVIIALKEKIMSAGTYSNPAKISSLLDTFGNRVETNFSPQDLSRLYQLGKEIPQSKMASIGLADPPNNYVVTDMIGGQSVVVPRAGNGNFKEIQAYLRNTLRDSFIKNENASVMVLNGTTTPGLATTKSDELKSFGYNVTDVSNAPTKDYTKTTIVDMRSGSKKYTKSYLEKRFNVSSVTALPDATIQPGTADFVIILGSDQATSGTQ